MISVDVSDEPELDEPVCEVTGLDPYMIHSEHKCCEAVEHNVAAIDRETLKHS